MKTTNNTDTFDTTFAAIGNMVEVTRQAWVDACAEFDWDASYMDPTVVADVQAGGGNCYPRLQWLFENEQRAQRLFVQTAQAAQRAVNARFLASIDGNDPRFPQQSFNFA